MKPKLVVLQISYQFQFHTAGLEVCQNSLGKEIQLSIGSLLPELRDLTANSFPSFPTHSDEHCLFIDARVLKEGNSTEGGEEGNDGLEAIVGDQRRKRTLWLQMLHNYKKSLLISKLIPDGRHGGLGWKSGPSHTKQVMCPEQGQLLSPARPAGPCGLAI